MRTLCLSLVLLLTAALTACTNAEFAPARTQIMLRVSRDAMLVGQMTELRVSVSLREGDAWKTPVPQTFADEQLDWPVDIPIIPRVHADTFKQFQVVVEALRGETVLAQARAISSFAPGEQRVLGVTLYLCPNHAPGFVCADSACNGESCEVCSVDGTCVPVESIDPNDLEPLSGSSTNRDASTDASDERPDGATGTDGTDGTDGARVDAGAQTSTEGGAGKTEAGAGMDGAMAEAGVNADAEAGSGSTLEGGDSWEGGGGSEGGMEAGTEGGTSGPSFVPVRFSTTDHDSHVYFSPDGLSAENRGEPRGCARSDRSVASGSGVFYFEGQRLIGSPGQYGIGVASASAVLSESIGENAQSLGLMTDGNFVDTGSTCTGSSNAFDATQTHYGFVVDYRGANARVHVVLEDDQSIPHIARSCTSTLSTPLHIFYAGVRYEVGYQMAINAGSDTTNFPFYFSTSAVKAALSAIGDASAAAALVPGFGQTRALPSSAAPVLVRPADRTVAAGDSVLLTGTASDAEDGNLTNSIVWTDLSSQRHAPVTGSGGSFSFTAGLGRHPIRMSVTDSVGRTTAQTIMVTTSGSVVQFNPVRLTIDDLSDQGPPSITLDTSGLGADFRHYTDTGMRANQAIFGQYWYFEVHRMGGPANIAVGVTTRDANLNPFDLNKVPWSAYAHLTGSTYYNGNSVGSSWDSQNNHVGFAVDYRGEHPIVHIILGGATGATSGVYHQTIVMKDVWLPLHPMLYGTWVDEDPALDVTFNFGATPFVFNPVTVLGATRAAGLQSGWGNANAH